MIKILQSSVVHALGVMVGSTLLTILLLACAGSAATLTVDDSGGADYARIQHAIDNASAEDTWGVTQNGTVVEISYGSDTNFPQYAALHIDSGYFRMVAPDTNWGTSIIILPSFWENGTYHQGAPVTYEWYVEGSDLILLLSGNISTLTANAKMRIYPPAGDTIMANIESNVTGNAELDNRTGEAFKPVMLSSMHVSSDLWDAYSAYADSTKFSIPDEGWIVWAPVKASIFGLKGGISKWKNNAPTVEIHLNESFEIAGWVTNSSNPNDDNVGFWAASSDITRTWNYTIEVRKELANVSNVIYVPDNGTLLGVSYNSAESEQDIKDLKSLENWSEQNYSLVVIFQSFSPDEHASFPKKQLDNLWQNGNTPLLTLEPWGEDILDVINNGTLDPYFERYAKDLKNWTVEGWTVNEKIGIRKQLLFRFAHEMNLHGYYPWSNKSPSSYINAWKRVHDIFEEQGLTSHDVQWIWSVNNVDVPSDGYKAEEYYPGDVYVDWVAIDGYNPGKSVPCADWDNWMSFDDIFKNMLNRFDNHPNISKKPYAITEFGSSSVVDSKPVKEFNVYTNKNSPTNHYISSGWMGDFGDISFDDNDTTNPHSGVAFGNSSIKIIYSANGSQGNGWAGIYWQDPENNWGDKEGGYDLSGASNLTFWARGEKGGEKSEFMVGGLGSLKPAVSTGVITLTKEWKQYTIDLSEKNLSRIIGGFYWVTGKTDNPNGCTIYLDDIRYESSTGIKNVCVEEGISNNTKKGEWITEAYNSIKNYPKIKMASYFNIDKGGTKYLTGESDWAVFTTPGDNRNNIDDYSFDPNKRINQYSESVKDSYYFYKFPLYIKNKTIYVDDDFTDDPENHKWNSIQEGINDAADGDMVFVYNGTYYENVIVNKSLILKGENKDNTVIDGSRSGDVVKVTADNCVMDGFTVWNSSLLHLRVYAGIRVISNETVIENNNISNNGVGVHIYKSNNTVSKNRISNNTDGIFLEHSTNNTFLISNNILSNQYGIYLYYSSSNTIILNNISSNNIGILLQYSSNDNLLYHNNIANNINQAFNEGANNSWHSIYPSGGNHWSDYTGVDLKSGANQDQSGSDGIGDIPYNISGGAGAQDRYPFMKANGWISAVTKGDVNGDGQVTVVDALFVAQYTVGLRTLSSKQLAAADVNGDGQVNIVDALFIAQYTVGLRQL